MTDFFKELFEYHRYFNEQVGRQLKENKGKIPENAVALYCHIINAHQIWNARILDVPAVGVWENRPLEDCDIMNENNYRDTIRILDERVLDEMISYRNSAGGEYCNSIRDILFHIGNHSTHHKAQIVSALRQNGIEPVKTDYIFYKR